MSDVLEDLDDILDIEEVTVPILKNLAGRIGRSRSWEQMIYREAEIDQIWRLIDRPVPLAAIPPQMLSALRAKIMTIHDLVGVSHNAAEAARQLDTVIDG